MSPQNNALQALTGLRFWAALAVVVHHASGKLGLSDVRLPLGNFAVAFFFVLSGFILTYAYHGRLGDLPSVRRFWLARFARIWPLHVVCFGLSLWLVRNVHQYLATPEGWGQLTANLFLLQTWVPNYRWGFSVNGVSWSISNEMFFYALFPWLVSGGLSRVSRKYAAVGIATLIALATLHACSHQDALRGYVDFVAAVHINPALRLFEFTTGIVLGHWLIHRFQTSHTSAFRARDLLGELSALALILAAGYVVRQGWLNATLSQWGLLSEVTKTWARISSPVFVFAIVIWIFSLSRGPVAWVLSRRPMVFLGEISFSLYMVHHIVIQVLARAYEGRVPPPEPVVWLAILGLSLAASACLYRWVELPCKEWILGITQKNQGWSSTQQWGRRQLEFLGSRTLAYSGLVTALVLLGLGQYPFPDGSDQSLRIADVMSESIFDRPIQFGDDAILYGAKCEPTDTGLKLTTVWRGIGQSDRRRFLHVCNEQDAILRHARQSTRSRQLKAESEIWIDEVEIPLQDLKQAAKLGIGFHSPDTGMARVQSGPRSLHNFRLDIPIPQETIRVANQAITSEEGNTILR